MIKLRQATRTDIESLLNFVVQLFAFEHIRFDRTLIRRALLELLDNAEIGTAYFFDAGDTAFGYGIITYAFDHEFGGRVAVLTDFYLEEEYRGRGYGKNLLALIEQECLRQNATAIELQVSPENYPARKLYETFGFEAFDRIPMTKILAPPANAL